MTREIKKIPLEFCVARQVGVSKRRIVGGGDALENEYTFRGEIKAQLDTICYCVCT